jgi:hypothetical protein
MVKRYVDDGNFMAPSRVMKTNLKILCAEETFLKYGYKLNKNKSCNLMGKCENNETANSRYRVLVDRFGLCEDIIKLHPSNYDDRNDVQQTQVESEFGVEILGAFVGTDYYMKRQLKILLEELTLIASSLINYPDLQGRLLLFRLSFMAKPLRLFRTTRSDLLVDFITDFGVVQKQVICSILNCW